MESSTRSAIPSPAGEARARWSGAFQDLRREHDFLRLEVEGRLPPELDGTLFRNGPALLTRFGEPYGHLFDGDGAVVAVRLSGGAAWGAVRLVQTRHLLEEQKAGRALFASYGTPGPVRSLARLRNPANTSVLLWQGRLFALNEGGLPVELSATDLSTVGERSLVDFGMRTFSAHPRRVVERGATYNFGMRWGARPTIDLFELPDSGPARRLGSLRIAGNSLVHDFAATPRHLIFLIPPLRLALIPTLLGHSTFSRNLHWHPEEGTEVLVVPIDEPQRAHRIRTEPFFQWHLANAFEQGDTLCVDLVRYPDFSTNRWVRDLGGGRIAEPMDGKLHRATIDLRRGDLLLQQLSPLGCEFPQVAPQVVGREHRFVYLLAQSPTAAANLDPPDLIARLDLETREVHRFKLDAHQLASEAMFVASREARGEDCGLLLSLVYDGMRDASFLAVFDARTLGDGPLARVWFPQPLPFTFHGAWRPGGSRPTDLAASRH